MQISFYRRRIIEMLVTTRTGPSSGFSVRLRRNVVLAFGVLSGGWWQFECVGNTGARAADASGR